MSTKTELKKRAEVYAEKTHEAVQTIWDATNKGQRNKLLKNEKVKEILDRYGVNTDT